MTGTSYMALLATTENDALYLAVHALLKHWNIPMPALEALNTHVIGFTGRENGAELYRLPAMPGETVKEWLMLRLPVGVDAAKTEAVLSYLQDALHAPETHATLQATGVWAILLPYEPAHVETLAELAERSQQSVDTSALNLKDIQIQGEQVTVSLYDAGQRDMLLTWLQQHCIHAESKGHAGEVTLPARYYGKLLQAAMRELDYGQRGAPLPESERADGLIIGSAVDAYMQGHGLKL